MTSGKPRFITSLRGRFFIYTLALMMLCVLPVTYMINSLHGAVKMMKANQQEHIEEMMPVLELEQLIYRVERSLYIYLTSPQPEEARLFFKLGKELNVAFEQALAAPYGHADEKHAVHKAYQQWQQGQKLATSLVANQGAVRNLDYAAINDLRTRLDGMVVTLDRIRSVARSELQERVVRSESILSQAHLVMLLVFIASAAMTFVIAYTLLHTVFKRLDRLELAAVQLADGNLDARVEISGKDELSQFGEVFNTMAERLQQAQSRLQQQATRDGLTGLHNHAEFQRLLGEELSRSQRYRYPISLLLMDVDHFKEVNDRFGHRCGDRVLRHLAEILMLESRPADHIARYGGEEFVLVLPEVTHNGAMVMAERIRRAVAESPVTLGNGEPMSVTVSVGVATYPGHAASAEELIEKADRAMYLAKHAGRNLCISASMV